MQMYVSGWCLQTHNKTEIRTSDGVSVRRLFFFSLRKMNNLYNTVTCWLLATLYCNAVYHHCNRFGESNVYFSVSVINIRGRGAETRKI